MSFFAALALGICLMLGLAEIGSGIKKGLFAIARAKGCPNPEIEESGAKEVSLDKNPG